MKNIIKRTIDRIRRKPLLVKPVVSGCTHLFGEVNNGYQYCKTCGIAIVAPKSKCEQHNWEIIDKYSKNTTYRETPIAVYYISRCVNCGLIKKDTLSCRD
jgi:hypothetical protein